MPGIAHALIPPGHNETCLIVNSSLFFFLSRAEAWASGECSKTKTFPAAHVCTVPSAHQLWHIGEGRRHTIDSGCIGTSTSPDVPILGLDISIGNKKTQGTYITPHVCEPV